MKALKEYFAFRTTLGMLIGAFALKEYFACLAANCRVGVLIGAFAVPLANIKSVVQPLVQSPPCFAWIAVFAEMAAMVQCEQCHVLHFAEGMHFLHSLVGTILHFSMLSAAI